MTASWKLPRWRARPSSCLAPPRLPEPRSLRSVLFCSGRRARPCVCGLHPWAQVYSEAIKYAPKNHVLFSNRSMCYGKLGRYVDALTDAKTVVAMMPTWAKGFARLAAGGLRTRACLLRLCLL